MNYIRIAWDFLVRSSENPQKISMTVKGTLITAIPVALQLAGFACTFGNVCVDLNADLLTALAQSTGTLVFHAATILGVGFTIWGLARKIWRTALGKNDAIAGYLHK